MPHPHARALLALVLLVATPALAARARAPRCPPESETLIATGWKAYRADSALVAAERFGRADQLCPIDLDAKVGLGFSSLKLGYLARAESLFARVTQLDPGNSDGWDGLMNAAWRLGDNIEALRAARRSWQLHPGNSDARLILDHLYPGWDRPQRAPFKRPDSLVVPARAANQRFEVRRGEVWSPFYVKGIHLGASLPGGSATDVPADSARYAGWLEGIAGMNANTVRVATLLPPDFYRALAGWNEAHPQRALWLIQGVETAAPPGGAFDDPLWREDLRAEARDAVDAVHGDAARVARPGRAAGRYDADVSRWTLAWVLGSPWAPAAVQAWDEAHPGRHMSAGRLVAMADGSATEGWLVARCDELLGYEVERYNALRPIAWAGGPASGTDPHQARATAENPAGWFACPAGAHEPAVELAHRYAGLAVLVDGYGAPSSRGAVRAGPRAEGGHDEAGQAAIDARLTHEIRASGCAGGVLFEWMDEWWRHSVADADLEAPAERARLWHNVMDPDQHHGVLAMDAGAEGESPELGGDPARWRALRVIAKADRAGARGAPLSLGVGADAAYVYLAVALGPPRGRAFPWDSLGMTVALDTYRVDRGQRALPGRLASGDIGFEFVAELAGPAAAALRVTPDYDPGTAGDDGRRGPIVTTARDDGRFDALLAHGFDRGRLRRGTLRQSTLSDWTYDRAAGLIEIRLPWTLLNVTDPSSGTVLYHDREGVEVGTAASDGFRIGVITWRKGASPRPIAALPALRPGRRWSAADFPTWTWATWEEPEYHARLKPAYEAMREAWGGMTEELSSAGESR